MVLSIDNIKDIELEITSDCNAACPACSRTEGPELYTVKHFSLADVKRMFPDTRHIEGKVFKLCGALGEPIVNPECYEISEYLVNNGGFVSISTNGGYQKPDWWRQLARLSANTQSLEVCWCVDGYEENNHFYRVNVNWKVLTRNMQAYSEAGEGKARACWMYNIFDYNEDTIEKAREHAHSLKFNFKLRRAMRNFNRTHVSKIKYKDKETRKIAEKSFEVKATKGGVHSKAEKVSELAEFIASYNDEYRYPPITKPEEKYVAPDILEKADKEIIPSINCKFLHGGHIFITYEQTLWPCCFLWDSWLRNRENIRGKLMQYGKDFNDLKKRSIEEVLAHPYYSRFLEESWRPGHSQHLPRCIQTCAYNKAWHNEHLNKK